MLTDQDIVKLVEAQKRVFATKKDVMAIEERVTDKFSDLQSSVDRYLKFTEAWHQELTILKSRQDRLAQVLIDKGVVSEKEIALLG
ncbi:MAG: hypothetical protein AAB402_02550 [Patescibacteria group bacterium]